MYTLSKLLILASTVLIIAADAGGAQCSAPGPTYLWQAGMEDGDMQEWYLLSGGGEFNNGTGTSAASTEQARTGSYSAKLTINPAGADDGARLFRWIETRDNDVLYFKAWYYLPEEIAIANFWNLMQWKSKVDPANDPFWIVNIANRPGGEMYLYLRDWQNSISYLQTELDVPVATWFSIEAYYRIAEDATGEVIIWQDGQEILRQSNVPTVYVANEECGWSVNNYSDNDTGLMTVYIDDASISLTRH